MYMPASRIFSAPSLARTTDATADSWPLPPSTRITSGYAKPSSPLCANLRSSVSLIDAKSSCSSTLFILNRRYDCLSGLPSLKTTMPAQISSLPRLLISKDSAREIVFSPAPISFSK